MIVFDLRCGDGHRFEGWFSSSGDFDSQRQRGLLGCPTCGSAAVERLPSATRFNTGAEAPRAAAPEKTPEMEGKDPFAIAQMLYSKMLDDILSRSEDVGNRFPEEARKIYYKESAARAIRGEASQEEHDALVDEGIPVARFPLPPKGDWN